MSGPTTRSPNLLPRVVAVESNSAANAAALIPKTLVNAKGDIIAATADDAVVRVAVGADGQVLTADAASAAGVKWAAATGGGGSGLTPTAIKTAAYTLAAGQFVPVDSSAGAIPLTLPTAPPDKTQCGAKIVLPTTSPGPVTILCGGSDTLNRAGGSTAIVLSVPGQAITLQYVAATSVWLILADDLPLAQLDNRFQPRPSILGDCVPIATRTGSASGAQFSNVNSATNLGGTYRVIHMVTAPCTGVRLVFQNASGLTDNANPITVRASIEPALNDASIPPKYIGVGGMIPVTFNGSRTVVLDIDATVISDPIGLGEAMIAGSKFFVRSFVSVASAGMKWPLLFPTNQAGEGNNRSDTPVDLTLLGTVPAAPTTAESAFGPVAIVGYGTSPSGRPSPIIGCIGDSIMAGGYDEPSSSFLTRALRAEGGSLLVPLCGFMQLGIGGDDAPSWWSTASYHWRFQLIEACTHYVCNYGINSIGSDLTLAQLQVNEKRLWRLLNGRGKPVFHCTLTPYPGLTAPRATVRAGFNDWLRDGAPVDVATSAAVAVGTTGATIARAAVYGLLGALVTSATGPSGHPLTGVFDLALHVETAVNSNAWVAANYVAADGVHPTPIGNIVESMAINRTALGIAVPPLSPVAVNSVPGLYADYDASVSPPADNTALATIPDRSGGGHDGTQPGASTIRPVYRSAKIDGKGAYHFDGVDDFFALPDISAWTAGTVYAVLRAAVYPNTVSGKCGLWNLGSSAGGTLWTYTDGLIYERFGTTAQKLIGGTNIGLRSLAAWNIYTVHSGTDDWQAFVNGGLLAKFTAATGGSVVGFPAAPTVGKSSGGFFFEGDIARLLLYKDIVHTAAQRQATINTLGAAYPSIDVGASVAT